MSELGNGLLCIFLAGVGALTVAAGKSKEGVANIRSPELVEKIMSRVDDMTPEKRASLKAKLEGAS